MKLLKDLLKWFEMILGISSTLNDLKPVNISINYHVGDKTATITIQVVDITAVTDTILQVLCDELNSIEKVVTLSISGSNIIATVDL
jgi:hypothetical protein